MNRDQFLKLTEKQILALVIYGEARGESAEGKIAVGSVILERVKRDGWFGKNLHDVILKPYQFSCFLEQDPNYPKLLHIAEQWDEEMTSNAALNDCYGIASGLLSGKIPLSVMATHYKVFTCNVYWTKEMVRVTKIAAHEFYI